MYISPQRAKRGINPFAKYHRNKEYHARYLEELALLDIAIAIAEVRQKHRLTQAALARKAGMKQSQIARLERGQNNVTVATLAKVASVLGKKLQIQ